MALSFGMEWDNRGAWLYTTEVSREQLDNEWTYAGIVDEDLGGTTRMYLNKKTIITLNTDV